MAITIMGGLFVATALTLLVVPVLYALWFRVCNNETVDATDGLPWGGSVIAISTAEEIVSATHQRARSSNGCQYPYIGVPSDCIRA